MGYEICYPSHFGSSTFPSETGSKKKDRNTDTCTKKTETR